MSQFTSEAKFAFALDIWEQCSEGATTFYDSLVAFTRGQVQKTKTGYQITSTSGPGYSTSFSFQTSLTPLELQSLGVELLRMYSQASAIVGADEATIWAHMQGELLNPCNEFRTDFSQCRF